MVWFWGGPSAADAPAGLIFGFGALDFAGGTVVHINAGIAGLVGCLMIGKRIGYGKDMMAPHSMTLTMVGASPALGRLVRLQRRLQPRGQRLRGAGDDQHLRRDRRGGVDLGRSSRASPAARRRCSAPSRARSPASSRSPRRAGFAGPMGAIVLGIVATIVCYFFVAVVKNALEL